MRGGVSHGKEEVIDVHLKFSFSRFLTNLFPRFQWLSLRSAAILGLSDLLSLQELDCRLKTVEGAEKEG